MRIFRILACFSNPDSREPEDTTFKEQKLVDDECVTESSVGEKCVSIRTSLRNTEPQGNSRKGIILPVFTSFSPI